MTTHRAGQETHAVNAPHGEAASQILEGQQVQLAVVDQRLVREPRDRSVQPRVSRQNHQQRDPTGLIRPAELGLDRLPDQHRPS